MEKREIHDEEDLHHDEIKHDDVHTHHDDDEHDETIVDEEATELDSFKSYPSSDDEHTKIVDGEKVVEDFHLYKEETDEKE